MEHRGSIVRYRCAGGCLSEGGNNSHENRVFSGVRSKNRWRAVGTCLAINGLSRLKLIQIATAAVEDVQPRSFQSHKFLFFGRNEFECSGIDLDARGPLNFSVHDLKPLVSHL